MPTFIVFGSRTWETPFGKKGITWEGEALGVYEADSVTDACLAAAKDTGKLTTFFAVEGTVWGLDQVDKPSTRTVGLSNDGDRLTELGRQLDQKLDRLLGAGTPIEIEGTTE